VCIKNHPTCSKPFGPAIKFLNAPLPTRCIRIDDIDSNGNIKAHLEETLDASGCYMTLNHRWNAATENCITTTKNIDSRKLGNQFDLPKLFKGSLFVVFKFGIKYVWIDSLCIIQDGDDFKKEILRCLATTRLPLHACSSYHLRKWA